MKQTFARITFILFIMLSFTHNSAKGGTPDFAYPDKVIEESNLAYKRAMAGSNWPKALRALLDTQIAQAMVNSDSVPAMAQRLRDLAGMSPDPAYSSMLYVLRATMLGDIYTSHRFVYDQRPATRQRPDDITEWSGADFRAAICEALNSALGHRAAALKLVPLERYKASIIVPAEEQSCFPTVFDFIAWRAIILRNRVLDPDDAAQLNAETLDELKRAHVNDTDPLFAIAFYETDNADPSFDEWVGLYNRFRGKTPLAGMALAQAYSFKHRKVSAAVELYELAADCLACSVADGVRKTIQDLRKALVSPWLSYVYPELVAPRAEMTVELQTQNLRDVTVKLWQLPYNEPNATMATYADLKSKATLVQTVNVHISDILPCQADTTATLTMPGPGYYVVTADGPGLKTQYNNATQPLIHCSGVIAMPIHSSTPKAVAISTIDGSPVAGAQLLWLDRNKVKELGKTNAAGFADIAEPGRYKFALGSDIYSTFKWMDGLDGTVQQKRLISLYTDLPVYQPGDTVRFAGVLYNPDFVAPRTLGERVMDCTLRDCNRQLIDSVKLKTDAFGRFSGSFTVPYDGITGGYEITAVAQGFIKSSKSFMVSDYKLPTFQVTLDPVLPDTPAKGDATVRGVAMGFNGVPVAGADVQLSVTAMSLWRWMWTPEYGPIVVLQSKTDADGRFAIPVDAAAMVHAEHPYFVANVSIAAPDGETQYALTRFTNVPAVAIRANVPEVFIAGKAHALDAVLVDVDGSEQPGIISCNVKDKSGAVVAKASNANGPMMLPKSLAVGIYTLEFTADGAETLTQTAYLYKTTGNISPSTDLLWVPSQSLKLDADGSASLVVATPQAQNVLTAVYSDTTVLKLEWIKLKAGMNTIPVKASPMGGHVLLYAMRNAQAEKLDIELLPAQDKRHVTLTVECMRDRVTPGGKEHWTLRFADYEGKPLSGALMLDIYNKALNVIQSEMPFGPLFINRSPAPVHFGSTYRDYHHNSLYGKDSRDIRFRWGYPEWQLYGRAFGFDPYGTIEMKRAAVTDSGLMYNAEVCEDACDMESATGGASDAGAVPDPRLREVVYADNARTSALWMPDAVFGQDGTLEITWDVPPGNGSWQFRAMAWTDDLRNALSETVIVASKPVMVQLNLPRFVRQGDTAEVLATVFNRTDSVVTADVITELFTLTDGTVIDRHTSQVTIPAGQSAMASYTMHCTDNGPIGYRVAAVTDGFSDGVRAVLDRLPAATPVVDSTPIMLGAQQTAAEVSVPAVDAPNAVTTIEYCDNPLWYIVLALPGISQETPMTAPAAADGLFNIAVARDLMRRSPAIADAIRQWHDSDSQTLTSMLERNQELKTMMLNATPWVRQAMDDTERMHRLALMLDAANLDAAQAKAVGLLSSLQNEDGSLGWCPDYPRGSVWATETVLRMASRLTQLGIPLPDGLEPIVAGAVKYCDDDVARTFAKYPDVLFTDYAIIRYALAGRYPLSSATAKAMKRTVDNARKHWADMPLNMRAPLAMMLAEAGHLKDALKAVESLRQFMVSSPVKGTYVPTFENTGYGYISYTAEALAALAVLTPGAPEADDLWQDLVIQKQATEWGNGSGASDAIWAILTAAGNEVRPAGAFAVTVNGKELPKQQFDSVLGYQRAVLDAPLGAGALTVGVTRQQGSPAWGGVVRRHEAVPETVEAAGCADLTIEKELLCDSLTVGAKATVRLVLHVGRNMSYVAIADNRAACMEPVVQTPHRVWSEGISFMAEPRDAGTNIFIDTLPKGVYVLTYEVTLNNAGDYSLGLATVQSQQAPELSAHSAGSRIKVSKR